MGKQVTFDTEDNRYENNVLDVPHNGTENSTPGCTKINSKTDETNKKLNETSDRLSNKPSLNGTSSNHNSHSIYHHNNDSKLVNEKSKGKVASDPWYATLDELLASDSENEEKDEGESIESLLLQEMPLSDDTDNDDIICEVQVEESDDVDFVCEVKSAAVPILELVDCNVSQKKPKRNNTSQKSQEYSCMSERLRNRVPKLR
eukprot:TRINITY_DN7126_c0_g1_i8.p1 TRINITY_DN7126_c0_g1~~TRINITY_DN7126_c0_g1_i8.p1  ORF type:complete len:230 (-),score=23.93 TRINITY_DN7126_c0_g1_i8:346-954(-)